MTFKPLASPLSPEFKQQIDHALGSERRLWAGQPDPRRAFNTSLSIWLFAVPWTAFALFWTMMSMGGALQSGSWIGFVFALWGLPFIAVGLGMLLAPLWFARTARRTVYVLTEQRLVRFIKTRTGVSIRSTWPRDIHSIELTERVNGKGDLKISFGSKRDSDGDLVEKSETLAGVGAARDLERLLRQAKTEARVP